MKCRIHVATSLVFTCGLFGCPAEDEPPPGFDECAEERYLGILDGRTDCGEFAAQDGTWIGSPLFSLQEGYLGQFCVYEWSPGDTAPDVSALPGPMEGVVGLTRDCPVVSPQGETLASDRTLRALIFEQFMAHIGKPAIPSQAASPDPAVSLFVIDTIPDTLLASGAIPNSRHGLTLRELIGGLTCDQGQCIADITSILGLPRLRTDTETVDRERGGYYGSLSDLARGVVEATDLWQRIDGEHLLLVLAAGWEPRDTLGPVALLGRPLDELLTPDTVETVPAPVQAILAALVHAACQDAIVIASAGNASSMPCTQSGPVGPAFLAQLPAPTAPQCEHLGFRAASGLTDADGSPLVHAVSHVGFDDGPLSNARHGATASLVAQGVTFGTVDGAGEMLTGSSVSAAVAGVTAAWVWSYFPSLSAAEVMRIVYDSGRPLPGGASSQFQLGERSVESRQVSICGALAAACTKVSPDDCTSLPGCAALPDRTDELGQYSEALLTCTDVSVNRISIGADFSGSSRADNACGLATITWPSTALPTLKPLPWPWAEPTPPVTHCPRCLGVYSAPTQQLTVGLSFSGRIETEHPVLIEVTTSEGIHQYPLPLSEIQWDRTNVVEIHPDEVWSDVSGVRLVYYVENARRELVAQGDPLLLLRDGSAEGSGPTMCAGYDCETGDDAVVCDEALDLTDKTNKRAILQSLGICDAADSIIVTSFEFDPLAKDNTWQLATGFGSHFRSTEGATFVMLSTGVIAPPDGDGLVVEAKDSQLGGADNENSDEDALPRPFSVEQGSNDGLGGTPFQDCDNGVGDNDCSDTLYNQWNVIGTRDLFDRIYWNFTVHVPENVTRYSLDVAFCSSEWPNYVDTAYNDTLIVYQVDPTDDDPEHVPPVDPYSGNVALAWDGGSYLPMTVTGLDTYFQDYGFIQNAPELVGTGFESNACTNWLKVEGPVQPGTSLTLGVLLGELGDDSLNSVALLDNFRWECSGCSFTESTCGVAI